MLTTKVYTLFRAKRTSPTSTEPRRKRKAAWKTLPIFIAASLSFAVTYAPAYAFQIGTKNARSDKTDAIQPGMNNFGFNEELISGYIQSSGAACLDCAGNSPPISLSVAHAWLHALASKGTTIMREIVPEKFVADPILTDRFETILKEYQDRHFTVIFTLAWPTSGNYGACYGFGGSEGEFNLAVHDYSEAVAGLFTRLRGRGVLSSKWLANHVLIEPWNEFDGLCNFVVGTPQKAARYHNAMEAAFRSAHLPNEVLPPSIVNSFNFTPPPTGTYHFWKLVEYMKQYYTAGGTGRPNIHIYFDVNWSSDNAILTNLVENAVLNLNTIIPKQYQKRTIIGETGVVAQTGNAVCDKQALPESRRADLYQRLISSGSLRENTDTFLFWRLFDLQGTEGAGCDQFDGVTDTRWSLVASARDALGSLTPTGNALLQAAALPATYSTSQK